MLKTHRLQKKELENEVLNKNDNKGKNTTFHRMLSSSGKNLGRKKSVHFEEEKEEEIQEILSLPPVFSLEINENTQDEGVCINKAQNNKDDMNDDDNDNDYYQ